MFAHRLCERLGGMTVDEMLARMSHREFVRWQRFDALRPPTPEEQRHATLLWWIGKVGRITPPPWTSLLPRPPRKAEGESRAAAARQTDAEIRSALRAIAPAKGR